MCVCLRERGKSHITSVVIHKIVLNISNGVNKYTRTTTNTALYEEENKIADFISIVVGFFNTL